MTKKRFIKLLMSRGVSRNEAHSIAKRYNHCSISYREAYNNYWVQEYVVKSFQKLGAAMREAAVSMADCVYSLKKLAEVLRNNEP